MAVPAGDGRCPYPILRQVVSIIEESMLGCPSMLWLPCGIPWNGWGTAKLLNQSSPGGTTDIQQSRDIREDASATAR